MNNLNIGTKSDSLHLSRIKEKLFFNGLDIDELLNELGTPTFIFSEKQLLTQYHSLKRSFSSELKNPVELAFSIKANPHPEIVQILINQDSFFEVTSEGEIKRILELGGTPEKIIYTNLVKTKKTIEFALKTGVKYYAIDSYNDMKRIENVAKDLNIVVKIMIRVNPLVEFNQTQFSCSGPHSKIGLYIPENLDQESPLKSVILYCLESQYLDLIGVHMHLGSQITDIELYQAGFHKVCNFITQLLDNNIKITVFDIGGGFPVDYGSEYIPSIAAYVKVVKSELRDSLNQLEVIIESGRFISAPAGILAFSVANLKQDPQGVYVACLDGSFYNTLPDTIFANWNYPIVKVIKRKDESVFEYRFVGSTNDTLDQYLPRNSPKDQKISCEKLKEGDKILFLQAGAYSLSFSSTYTLEKRPKVYIHRKT